MSQIRPAEPLSTSLALAQMAALILRPGARDVAEIGVAYNSAFESMVRELAKLAAEGASLGLVTGAYMAWAPAPAAETDGPVGVAVLARVLRDLGARPVVITDDPCYSVVRACLNEVANPEEVLVSVSLDASKEAVSAIAAQYNLQHVMAVERLGPAASGQVFTMRGVDITASTAPLDALFSIPGLKTSAIGDGGNELGMGNLSIDELDRVIRNASKIACRTSCDNLAVYFPASITPQQARADYANQRHGRGWRSRMPIPAPATTAWCRCPYCSPITAFAARHSHARAPVLKSA